MQLKRDAGIEPDALRTRPELPTELASTYNAFTFLNKARGGNMAGEQPLRLSDIAAYLAVVGETCQDRRIRLLHLVSEMDGAYLEFRSKQA